MGVKLKPQVVAAIAAALFEILEEEKPSLPYVPKKNKKWKELGKHERCWMLRLGR
ncbi:MAG TPA: hypothetical protein PLN47_04310 [Candidatus Atribacteria bacterium]|nr:hypothetical protein [Candidatus Atribacteria bacterium]